MQNWCYIQKFQTLDTGPKLNLQGMFRRRYSKSVCDVCLIYVLRPGVWEVAQSTIFWYFLYLRIRIFRFSGIFYISGSFTVLEILVLNAYSPIFQTKQFCVAQFLDLLMRISEKEFKLDN